jgi:hypothetical protein
MREGDALANALEDLLEADARLLPGPLHASLVRWAAGVDPESGGDAMRQHRNNPARALDTCFEIQRRLMRRARAQRRLRGVVIPFRQSARAIEQEDDDSAEEALD